MKFVKTILAAAIASSAIATSVAQADVSTNIAVTNDYVWRGVSQTGNGAAVSGGIDYAADSGFFVGTWISNTSFGSAEMDLYAGFGGEAGDFGYSVTFNYYTYPTIDDANFGEILLDGSIGVFSFGLAYTAVSDVNGPSVFDEGDIHYYVGLGFDLGNDWSLGGTLGLYDVDVDGDEGFEDASYSYVQIDLGKSYGDWGDITVSLSKADGDVENAFGGDEDPIAIVGWSKGF